MNEPRLVHPSPERLEAFNQDQLAPAERADVGRHLASCPDCARRLGPPAGTGRAGPLQSATALFGLLSVTGLLTWAALRIGPAYGTLVLRADDPDVQVMIQQGGRLVLAVEPGTEQRVVLRAGAYELELAGPGEGLRLSADRVTVSPAGTVVVAVSRAGDADGPPRPVSAAPDAADRAAAEWVLQLGGAVDVQVENRPRDVSLLPGLARESFRLAGVRLSRNAEVTNAGLAQLRGLTGLLELNLSYNKQVGDEGLEPLARLTGLQKLHLESTSVTDASLERVVRGLTNLQLLNLSNTGVTDAGLVHLRALTRLTDLGLAYNRRVGDAGLAHLRGLKGLRVVSLVYSGVTDATLEQTVRGWTNLRQLHLGGTQVTDAGILHLGALVNLQDVTLAGSKVSDDGVRKLKALLPDCNVVHK